jgi:2-polyprenyl-3-methyl-5-hydroxy-6-metoxy-1,4-benzoquinol methylase
MTLYDDKFYSNMYKSAEWMTIFGEELEKTYSFKTVLDLGCGVGHIIHGCWLAGASVCGLDSGYEAAKKYVPKSIADYIHYADLSEPISRGKFGLVMSIETIEHLPENKADIFLDNIVNAANDAILFTAAVPGQKGVGHINLQTKEYWITKFNDRGFVYDHEDVSACRKILFDTHIGNPYLHCVSRNLVFLRRA